MEDKLILPIQLDNDIEHFLLDKKDILPIYKVPITKFSIPNLKASIIARKDALDKFNKVFENKLTLLTAPAGYGKSTFVSSWIGYNKIYNNCFWISLDKEDLEELTFWHNIIYSIQNKGIKHLDIQIHDYSIEQCINSLINQFALDPLDYYIVLDDYHYVNGVPINRSLDYLLTYIPKNLHFIIMSRTMPSLSVSRLILEENIALFDKNDLCFSSEETRSFLNEVMELNLTEDEVMVLVTKTEGWAAALKLAALALRNHTNHSAYINNFNSSNKELFQYVLKEIIYCQKPIIREFLIKTGILKNLNKSICNAVTGYVDSDDILESLNNDKLFITCLDGENYRYHSLLSDVLMKLLYKEYPNQMNNLYIIAGQWCEEHNLYSEAFTYYKNSKDNVYVFNLLKKYFNTKNQNIISPKKICDYFGSLPIGLYQNTPDLCVRYALACAVIGQVDKEERVLLERGINLNSENFESYQGLVSQVRVYIALKHENINNLLKYSEQSIELLPEEEIVTICLILGYIYRSLSDLKKAEEYFTNAFRISSRLKERYEKEVSESLLLSDFYITGIQFLKGTINDFIEPIHQLLQENITHKNCMYFCLATTYYDYGELHQSYENVKKGLELCDTYEDIFYEKVKGLVLLAKIMYHSGRIAEAVNALNAIDRMVKPDSGNMFILLELPRIINLLSLMGLTDRAEAYLNKFPLDDCKETKTIILEAHVELHIAKKNYTEAMILLEQIVLYEKYQIYPKKKMDIFLLQSIVYQECGLNEKALECLRKAIEIKDSERYVRSYIDKGDTLKSLLSLLIKELNQNKEFILGDKANKILDNYKSSLEITDIMKFDNNDILSKRESEVLRLLAGGFSYHEIGKSLFISLSTVKKHTSNIYTKLNVKNRVQAVIIANIRNLN